MNSEKPNIPKNAFFYCFQKLKLNFLNKYALAFPQKMSIYIWNVSTCTIFQVRELPIFEYWHHHLDCPNDQIFERKSFIIVSSRFLNRVSAELPKIFFLSSSF